MLQNFLLSAKRCCEEANDISKNVHKNLDDTSSRLLQKSKFYFVHVLEIRDTVFVHKLNLSSTKTYVCFQRYCNLLGPALYHFDYSSTVSIKYKHGSIIF